MRVDFRAALFLALAAGLTFASPAAAQSDTRGLVDRLDRLERDMSTLQGQVYRGGGSSTVITSPAASGGGGGAVAGDAYSRLDERLSALEQQLRDVTGQVEKANFTAGQLSAKMERMQADNDIRFKELEQKAGVAAPAANAAPALTPPSKPGAPEFNPTMGSPPGTLGHPGVAPTAPPPAAAGAALQGKTPQDQYDYAFGLLRANDLDGASRAFQAFIDQHPQDPLAGNAVYWLGQIPYSQGHYEQAAPLFLNAYAKYPKSAKAGESLLKVGLSLSNLGKKKEACSALARFSSEFPDAGDTAKRQAAAEKTKLGC